jgi:hypothetical protein
MLQLAQILQNEKLLNELKFVDSDEYVPIKEVVESMGEKNSVSACVIDKTKDTTFLSMNLYYSKEKELYYLESKINWHFGTEKDTYSACLLVFDENFNFLSEDIDDVNSFANWIPVDEMAC